MSDNITNKAICEIKIAKNAQNLTFCKIDSDVAQWGKIPVSLPFIVIEIWPEQNRNSNGDFLVKI